MSVDLQADVTELVNALKLVDQLRSVVTDPADLNTPGVFVRADGFALTLLRGYKVSCSVHMVVADTGADRSLSALSDLFNLVRPVLDEFGGAEPDVQLVGLTLPGSQSPLPSLVVQLVLDVEETE